MITFKFITSLEYLLYRCKLNILFLFYNFMPCVDYINVVLTHLTGHK